MNNPFQAQNPLKSRAIAMSYQDMPKTVSDVESDCGHEECTASLFSEILRLKSWIKAEDLCLVAEREEDTRMDKAEAEYTGPFSYDDDRS